jgi:hypothetical protein
MSRTQRLTWFGIAALVAIIAVVAIIAAGGGSGGDGSSNAASTGGAPLLTQGKVTKLRYTQGDQVRFRVQTKGADEVHVHGYNIEKETRPGQTLTIAFKATINGIFEIELHHADVQIGQLTVNPK